MASKWKKRLKKVGKAAAIAAALYGASKLGKKRLGADKLTEGDIGLGQRAPNIPDAPYIKKRPPREWMPHDEVFGGGVGFKKGGHVKSMGIAKRGGGAAKR